MYLHSKLGCLGGERAPLRKREKRERASKASQDGWWEPALKIQGCVCRGSNASVPFMYVHVSFHEMGNVRDT